MGIRITRDSDEYEDDYGSRRNKRVRISESNSHGSSIFFPTSDRVPIVPSTDSILHRSQSSRPLETSSGLLESSRLSDSNHVTTLRRRNAIRRRFLQNYPYRHTFGPLRRSSSFTNEHPTSHSPAVYGRSLMNFDLDPVFPSSELTSDYQRHHFRSSVRNQFYDLWQSTDDVLGHTNSNRDEDAENVDTPIDAPLLGNFQSFREEENTSEALGRVLPVIPPPLAAAGYQDAQNNFIDTALSDTSSNDDNDHSRSGNAFVTFEYNRDTYQGSSSAMSSPQPAFQIVQSPTFEKISLPRINNLVSNDEQLLLPRDDESLNEKANQVSRSKYGKVMASGVFGNLKKDFTHSIDTSNKR